jgi:hypothetical protein
MAAAKRASLPKMANGKAVPKKYRGLPASSFALGKGHYPINTPKRARNALSRVAQHGTPAQQATVKRAVARKFPAIKVAGVKRRGGK